MQPGVPMKFFFADSRAGESVKISQVFQNKKRRVVESQKISGLQKKTLKSFRFGV